MTTNHSWIFHCLYKKRRRRRRSLILLSHTNTFKNYCCCRIHFTLHCMSLYVFSNQIRQREHFSRNYAIFVILVASVQLLFPFSGASQCIVRYIANANATIVTPLRQLIGKIIGTGRTRWARWTDTSRIAVIVVFDFLRCGWSLTM